MLPASRRTKPHLIGLLSALGMGCTMAAYSDAQLGPSTSPEPLPTSAASAAPSLDEPPSTELSHEPLGMEKPGWLGVALTGSDRSRAGVEVTSVVPSSPAALVRIQPGDRLLRVGGESVHTPQDVVRIVSETGAGRLVRIAFLRGDRAHLVATRLEALPDKESMMRRAYIGRPAPPFERLSAAQGALPPSLLALRGQVLIVEFWAPWCAVCRLIAPELNAWHLRYAAQGALVLGVTTEPVAAAASAAPELGMDYPIFSDETARTSEAYSALALPTVFVIDQAGVVRDVLVGYDDLGLARLEQTVRGLLERP